MKFLTDNAYSLFVEFTGNVFFKNFTFVGGSAIGYYLGHRLSEDLDFFTWSDRLPEETETFINTTGRTHRVVIANRSDSLIDLFVDDIKITLFANNWELLKSKRRTIEGNIYVADIDLLCAMKVNALSLRAKYRDYYDLYILNKEKFTLQQMLDIAIEYIPGMTKKIFGMQLTYIDDIVDESIDHLQPKSNVSLIDIKRHFEGELKKIL